MVNSYQQSTEEHDAQEAHRRHTYLLRSAAADQRLGKETLQRHGKRQPDLA
jgi:hypothetical protein